MAEVSSARIRHTLGRYREMQGDVGRWPRCDRGVSSARIRHTLGRYEGDRMSRVRS
jgi:hypothetical protein